MNSRKGMSRAQMERYGASMLAQIKKTHSHLETGEIVALFGFTSIAILGMDSSLIPEVRRRLASAGSICYLLLASDDELASTRSNKEEGSLPALGEEESPSLREEDQGTPPARDEDQSRPQAPPLYSPNPSSSPPDSQTLNQPIQMGHGEGVEREVLDASEDRSG